MRKIIEWIKRLIMTITNGKITFGTKVTINEGLSEIAECLGDGRVDTNGNIDLGMMCTSPNINADSLIKPYEDGEIWSPSHKTGGADGKFGYNIPIEKNKDILNLRGKVWEWRKPTTMFRLQDFDGYNHNVRYGTIDGTADKWGMVVTLSGTSLIVNLYYGATADLIAPHNMPIFANAYGAISIYGKNISGSGIIGEWVHLVSVCSQYKIGENTGIPPISIEKVKSGYYNLDDWSEVVIVPYIHLGLPFNECYDIQGIGAGDKYALGYKTSAEYVYRTGGGGVDYIYSLEDIIVSSTNAYTFRIDGALDLKKAGDVALWAHYRYFDKVGGFNGGGNVIFEYTDFDNSGKTNEMITMYGADANNYTFGKEISRPYGSTIYNQAKSVEVWFVDQRNSYVFKSPTNAWWSNLQL